MTAREWTPVPRGPFSGIDWGVPGAANGYDPYLVWAEASGFHGYGTAIPAWLPVIVELAPSCSVKEFEKAGNQDWLRVPKVYTASPGLKGLRFCTAWIGKPFFNAMRPGGPLDGKVRRFELGLPVGHHVDAPPVESGRAISEIDKLKGPVLGLIDGGLAFANDAFLQAASCKSGAGRRARTRFFWRQDARGVGPAPHGLGYGHEVRGAEIENVIEANVHGGLVDEEAVYRHFQLTDLQKFANHGTHVMDLACGPRAVVAGIANLPPGYDAPPNWAPANDPASRADLVAVQLDWSNVLDTSGGSMNVSILDALMYILSCCADDADLVVNVSWGTLAGPHNGTSVLEAALDQLMQLRRRKLQIVLPAGNGYQDRLHANATLAAGKSIGLNWKVEPGDSTQSFLELWMPADASRLQVEVQPPGGSPAARLHPGQSLMWADQTGRAVAASIFPHSVATGRDATCALLALAPTFAFSGKVATSPAGIWRVTVTNTGASPATVDAYIERDDVALGQRTGARQSHLEDELYDTSGNPHSFEDVPVPTSQQLAATLIRRSGTFNSIATGKHTTTVGGMRLVGQGWAQWSLYSPRRADPDAERPQREGVVRIPDRMTIGDENTVLLGLSASGTFSGSTVRLVGTSGCAPLVARDIFNQLLTTAPAASF